MLAGYKNFAQIVVHLLGAAFGVLRKIGKTDNGVHRCADIVRHIEQEACFALVRCLRCLCELLLLDGVGLLLGEQTLLFVQAHIHQQKA